MSRTLMALIFLGGVWPIGALAQSPDGSAPLANDAQTGCVPFYAVRSVEIANFSEEAATYVFRVIAIAPSSGWISPILVPSVPGRIDKAATDFVVCSPQVEQNSQMGFVNVEAIFVQHGKLLDLPTVVVRALTNTVVLEKGATKAEITPVLISASLTNPDDYQQWIGKKLVHDAVQAAETVSETSLIGPYRILRPDDPIDDLKFDPNRLNIIVDGSDFIVSVFWR